MRRLLVGISRSSSIAPYPALRATDGNQAGWSKHQIVDSKIRTPQNNKREQAEGKWPYRSTKQQLPIRREIFVCINPASNASNHVLLFVFKTHCFNVWPFQCLAISMFGHWTSATQASDRKYSGFFSVQIHVTVEIAIQMPANKNSQNVVLGLGLSWLRLYFYLGVLCRFFAG